MARRKTKAHRSFYPLLIFIFVVLLGASAWPAPSATPALDDDAVIAHLNAAIGWYRHLATLDVTAGQPSDLLYIQNARTTAAQALQLAFQSALAEAALIETNRKSKSGTSSSSQSQSSADDQQPNLAKAAADIDDRIKQTQSQIDDLDKQIAQVSAKKRQPLVSQRDALQGELDLDKMIQEALQKIVSVSASGESGSGLVRQIQQLKQSVPEVFAATAKKEGATGQSSRSTRAQNSGLLGQTSILLGQTRDIHDIDQLMSETVRLRNTADKLDRPMRQALKDLIQQGRSLVGAPPTSDPAQVADMRRQFESLRTQFRQLSDAAVPLRQEIILLDQCHGELLEWRSSLAVEYGRVLRSLLLRVAGILLALGFVFVLSALWRRATYRYVREARRRRQLMVIRRFVTGFLMAVVIAAGFISEFSSLATFAGFITAGIAVALQTVILSVAAYFSLVGRYGVRVGDRVTVAGVTGDVIEIGLVRLYLMELAGTGIDLYPTGRIVVYSNSVMFQAAPFFKQIPGTSFAWHELAVTLSPDADHDVVERKLLASVEDVFSKYRPEMERQRPAVDSIMDASIPTPVPKARLHFGETGVEFVVRYPVDIRQSSDVDDEVTRKLMDAIHTDPELKASVAGSPRLRAPIKA